MALVKFMTGTAVQFAAATKDENTLYFVSDERRLYKGSVPYSGGIYQAVTADPESPVVNTLYINTEDGSVKFYNGTALQTVVAPYSKALGAASTHGELATAKAVTDYVAAQIRDLDISALTTRVKANEDAIAVINGESDGSIKAAQKAAEDHADSKVSALENGTVAANAAGVAANKAAIETLNGTGTGSVSKAVSDAKSELQAEIDKKATKATTLAGYGITDAYTKGEADTAIATAVNEAGHLKRSIVEALPTVDSADEHTIYMVLKKTGAAGNVAGNVYVEYMLVNGKFEQIGDSTVDLTDYAKTVDVENKISAAKDEAIAAAATDASAKADTAKSEAIDEAAKATDAKISALDVADIVAAGEYVSAVSQEDGKIKVTRATLPAAATLTTGTANGSVKFNGTDVAVKGLGSAAYTESSAYATAAQGKKADTALQTASITTGSANGTIAVSGTDVKVKGLGSASYTDASAYDAKGSADTAQSNAKNYTDDKISELKTTIESYLTWGSIQ